MSLNRKNPVKQLFLSRKVIQRYRSTRNSSEKQAIEARALSDDFDHDALDGWSDPQLTMLPLRRMDKRYSPRTSFSSWIIGGSIVVLALVGSYVYFQTTASTASQKNETSQHVTVEKTDLVLNPVIHSLTELPLPEQIAAREIRKDFHVKSEQMPAAVEERKQAETQEVINRLPVMKLSLPKHLSNPPDLHRFLAKEVYVSDLKLVDYRVYRSQSKIATQQLVLPPTPSGTPANIGESSELIETGDWQAVDVPYIDYLYKTMDFFSVGNNKRAIARFDEILKRYPEDVNALFYGGLCYYNLHNYALSAQYFQRCIRSKFLNFGEESSWYLSKVLLADKQIDAARQLLIEIDRSKGYYSEMARKLLEGL